MTKLYNWQEYGPLKTYEEQSRQISEMAEGLVRRLAELSEVANRVREELYDAEARVILGSIDPKAVDEIKTRLAELETEISAEEHKVAAAKRAQAMLEDSKTTAQTAAQSCVRHTYTADYRAAVKDLLEAVEVAAEANQKVYDIWKAAGRALPTAEPWHTDIQTGEPIPQYLPVCHYPPLLVTPPTVWGDCALVLWKKTITDFLEG